MAFAGGISITCLRCHPEHDLPVLHADLSFREEDQVFGFFAILFDSFARVPHRRRVRVEHPLFSRGYALYLLTRSSPLSDFIG